MALSACLRPVVCTGRGARPAQLLFERRELLSYEECDASRDYYDLCLGSEELTDPIEAGEQWHMFRPTSTINFDDCERSPWYQ